MKRIEIKFANLTSAQKSQRLLYDNNIPSRLIKTVNMGCGHALLIRADSIERAETVLKNSNTEYTVMR